MRLKLRQQMAQEVADWRHSGLIDSQLAEVLGGRYDTTGISRTLLLKWLRFFGIFMLGSVVLSFVGVIAQSASPYAGAGFLGGVAIALWYTGSRMAAGPAQKHPFTGSALLTLGLISGYGTMSAFYLAGGGSEDLDITALFMIVTGIAALATAYKYRLRWPLALALLLFFHGVGTWHAYAGHGTYLAGIQDEISMAVIAFLTVLLGLWHEHTLEATKLKRHEGFGSLYIIFGLLYVNLSLWFLTLPRGVLMWVLVFAAAAVAQIIAGARLKDARFTGFGIVFLSINLYTRYFEYFWDRLSAATFFIAAGILGMAFGMAFERLGRQTIAKTGDE